MNFLAIFSSTEFLQFDSMLMQTVMTSFIQYLRQFDRLGGRYSLSVNSIKRFVNYLYLYCVNLMQSRHEGVPCLLVPTVPHGGH